MFGYIRFDMPNLFVKDLVLYRAAYCGLCKGIAKSCGQRARLALTYDVAFLSVLLHNIAGVDLKVERQNCFEHAIRKRPIAVADEMTQELGAFNTLLAYAKLTDDINDSGKGRFKRSVFKKGKKRAAKRYPRLSALVDKFMGEQASLEAQKSPSPDMAAEPTAQLLKGLSEELLGEKANEATDELLYCIGKWVYLIDALDDYEKDKKSGEYNPFVLTYGCGSREELMNAQGKEIGFLFDTLFFSLREALGKTEFPFNRDLTDNILLRGIPIETARVMKGEPRQRVQTKI